MRRWTAGAGLLAAALAGCALAPSGAVPPPALPAPSQPPALPAPVALERLLAELRQALPPELRPGFELGQRQWQRYAEADCAFQRTLTDGGSVGALVYGQCMKAKAGQRVAELKTLLCEGFGLTGPCEASARYDRLAD